MYVVESSTDGNLCLKRIIAQRHNLYEMGIHHLALGHILFRGYVFAELAQNISQIFRAISSYGIKNRGGCVKINHLLDTEQLKIFESSVQISWFRVGMNDFDCMILQVLKFVYECGATLPQTALQYLNLVSTRLLYSVSRDSIRRNLTCFTENKADKSFLHMT